jgi:hypothetical protein
VLRSFRVVIKQTSTGKEPDFWLPSLNKDGGAPDSSIGAAVFCLGFVAAVVTVEGVYFLGRALVEDAIDGGHMLLGPPYTLEEEYSSGVTCEIRGTLLLHWSDGRLAQSAIAGLANSWSPNNEDHNYLGDDIGAVIRGAVWQMSQHWLQKNTVPSPP